MIDTESMGTGPNAAIVALGAVLFDEHTGQIGESFYRAIHLATVMRLNQPGDNKFVIEPGTVLWWLGQPDEVRNAILFGAISVHDAMGEFVDWLTPRCDLKAVKVWAASPAFDCIKVTSHLKACGYDNPWKYWNERDYRTIRERNRIVVPDERTGLHNAREDAIYQAKHLCKIRAFHAARQAPAVVG